MLKLQYLAHSEYRARARAKPADGILRGGAGPGDIP